VLSSLPNLLTLSRILAVPGLVALMWGPNPWEWLAAFGLYTLAAITDYFDGYLARSWGTVSKIGQFLDPIADKIMVAAVILMLVDAQILHGWSVIAGLIILLRVPVSQLAKWKTTAQLVALGALILVGAVPILPWLPAEIIGLVTLWIAAILTLITGYDYLRVGLKHM
jgi:CDP-diacylglycerol--glycerol-3-phosphate 3-phosphatidyltransferase/cardiolipin synthase